MTDSVLNLSVGLAAYSARGVTQTLEPDPSSQQMRRTVNGEMRDLSASQFRKYISTISCRDLQPPAFGSLWPGQIITVDCVVELCEEATTAGLERTAVSGSEREASGFHYYRPQLTMMVDSFSLDYDEWQAYVGWSLKLVEV